VHDARTDWHVIAEPNERFEAVELFERITSKGKKLEAILITHSGKRNEKIIGIVTVADLPSIQPDKQITKMI
jgi:hypothetical protein